MSWQIVLREGINNLDSCFPAGFQIVDEANGDLQGTTAERSRLEIDARRNIFCLCILVGHSEEGLDPISEEGFDPISEGELDPASEGDD